MQQQNARVHQDGHWHWRSYHRRSIGSDEVPEFMGWNKLLSLIDACNKLDYNVYSQDYCIERDKALISTLFETGGRIREILSLEKSNFDFQHPDYCMVRNMLLEKRFEKTASYFETVQTMPHGSHAKLYEPVLLESGAQIWKRKRWQTTTTSERILKLRVRKPFPIFKTEPLYPIMEKWVTQSHTEQLFPSPKKRKDNTRNMTASNAWQILQRVAALTGIQLFPHLFRSQRASQLFNEYGLTWEEIKTWFSWESEKMASLYAKISGETLAERMQKRIQSRVTKT